MAYSKIRQPKLSDVIEQQLEFLILEGTLRPGEKLHEVLITEDDARTTLDLGDRYVIEPALSFWKPDQFAELNPKPVRDGFRYGSDNNEDVLGEDGLKAILAGADK